MCFMEGPFQKSWNAFEQSWNARVTENETDPVSLVLHLCLSPFPMTIIVQICCWVRIFKKGGKNLRLVCNSVVNWYLKPTHHLIEIWDQAIKIGKEQKIQKYKKIQKTWIHKYTWPPVNWDLASGNKDLARLRKYRNAAIVEEKKCNWHVCNLYKAFSNWKCKNCKKLKKCNLCKAICLVLSQPDIHSNIGNTEKT